MDEHTFAKPVRSQQPQRSNSFDAGGAVLRALARSPHYNENLHRKDELEPVPEFNLNATPSKERTMYDVLVHEWEVPRKVFHCLTGFGVLYLYKTSIDAHSIIQVLFYAFLFIATADLLRLNSHAFERIYERVLGVLMREGEKERVNGVIWYLVGVMTSLHFFPEDIASVSIIVLSWCDPAASSFGRLLGKRTPSLPGGIFARRKSLAGFLAAGIVGTLIAYLFWGTSIAKDNERPSGLSWTPGGHATFGTPLMPDALRTGWRGFSQGIQVNDAGLVERLRNMTQTRAPALPPAVMYVACGLIAAVTEALELGGVDDNVAIPILFSTFLWAMLWAYGWIVSTI